MTKVTTKQMVPTDGWCTASTIRIKPINRSKAGPISKIILYVLARYGKLDAANLWLLMKRNSRLMRGLICYASKLMPFGEIDRIDTELVILRVAWNCRARYEWGQHVTIGLKVGLTTEDIMCIASDSYDGHWNEKQIALLKACDEFHSNRFINDSTWQQLIVFFNEKLLLELLFLIGFYDGLAGVLNSVGLPLDDGMEANLSKLSRCK